ncbi:MAG: metallophosphoesterase family protein [Planctomycetota bacterium]
MRTLAIGDIHGNAAQLDRLLDVVALRPDDRVVTLGDYVDRGPDSRGVLDRLLRLQETQHLVPLRGNHDQWMLNARHDEDAFAIWEVYGAVATLQSYPDESLDAVPETHWRFLAETCHDVHETDTHIFVHGHVLPDAAPDTQNIEHLHNLQIRHAEPHVSGKTVICGHEPQSSGLPLDRGFAVGIDTAGWLTCLDIDTWRYWQVNDDITHTRQASLRS